MASVVMLRTWGSAGSGWAGLKGAAVPCSVSPGATGVAVMPEDEAADALPVTAARASIPNIGAVQRIAVVPV
ncbi:MAG TPA: hypothetical protein VMQ73_10010 [Methylomirabilota bacterium]|nr:hypothetical protein [Methylomirabilota bacterium]